MSLSHGLWMSGAGRIAILSHIATLSITMKTCCRSWSDHQSTMSDLVKSFSDCQTHSEVQLSPTGHTHTNKTLSGAAILPTLSPFRRARLSPCHTLGSLARSFAKAVCLSSKWQNALYYSRVTLPVSDVTRNMNAILCPSARSVLTVTQDFEDGSKRVVVGGNGDISSKLCQRKWASSSPQERKNPADYLLLQIWNI